MNKLIPLALLSTLLIACAPRMTPQEKMEILQAQLKIEELRNARLETFRNLPAKEQKLLMEFGLRRQRAEQEAKARQVQQAPVVRYAPSTPVQEPEYSQDVLNGMQEAVNMYANQQKPTYVPVPRTTKCTASPGLFGETEVTCDESIIP
jgi:hypothetical protein